MAVWHKVLIRDSNVVACTDRAALIELNVGKYSGYKFWHPRKLIRGTRWAGASTMSFSGEFTFRLFLDREHQYSNRAPEVTIKAEEMKALYTF